MVCCRGDDCWRDVGIGGVRGEERGGGEFEGKDLGIDSVFICAMRG